MAESSPITFSILPTPSCSVWRYNYCHTHSLVSEQFLIGRFLNLGIKRNKTIKSVTVVGPNRKQFLWGGKLYWGLILGKMFFLIKFKHFHSLTSVIPKCFFNTSKTQNFSERAQKVDTLTLKISQFPSNHSYKCLVWNIPKEKDRITTFHYP